MSFVQNFNKFYQELQAQKSLSYRGMRARSWESLLGQGLPQRTEDWKYTSLAELNNLQIEPSKLVDIVKLVERHKLLANYLVIVNGEVQLAESSIPADAKLKITILDRKAEEESLNINSLGSLQKSPISEFQAVNSALFADAIILHFQEGYSCSAGLQILNITTGNFSAPRIYFKIAAGVKATIVESYHTNTEQLTLVAPLSEYAVGENAELHLYKIVQDSAKTYHVATQLAELKSYGRFYSQTFNLANGVTRNNIACRLLGAGSFASLVGLNVMSDAEHVDNYTVLDHVSANCESYELYKSVLGHRSKSVFNGTIIVQQDAQKTNAIQSNQSLILSTEAQSFSKPQLKIWADDVKCTHGATCGNLDAQAIFYLRARGIPEQQARQLLVEAFAEDVISQISDETIKEFVRQNITKKLSQIF